MRRSMGVALGLTLLLAPFPASAENGRITAGVLGGLAAGALIGSAISAPPRAYYGPPPVEYIPPPAYYAEPVPTCYWTRGEPVWDNWRGTWVRPRVQVCE